MAELDINKSTTTNLSGTVSDVTVSPSYLDVSPGEVVWDFPNAADHLGYYQTIPELQSALNVLALRVVGLGFETDIRTKVLLEAIIGWGEDTFDSIMKMMLIEKKVFGDSFAEIIKNEKGTLINIKKLYAGDIRIVIEDGIIKRYEQKSNVVGAKAIKFKPTQILHFCNNRIGNEIHGTSLIPVLKSIIDAKNEAMSDERKIRHRELALGILYVDTDDTTKRNAAMAAYQDAVNKGEVLVLGKDVAEVKDNPNAPRDRIQWLQYLDNYFYQVVGTPKVLVTSEGFTEAGGKAGLLAFEPTELAEKRELEQDLWNQLAIKIKFTRTPSLLGEAIGTEQKNAGQTGIQPNETQVSATRTE